MKRNLLLLISGLVSFSLFAQEPVYEFDFRHNNPNDVAKLLILLETGIDGSMGPAGFLADLNIGAIARYSLHDRIDLQSKTRVSYASFHFDPDYRRNFEIEFVGANFLRDKTKLKSEQVIVSESERGNTVTTKFFYADLPQRNAFGYNIGLNYKTLGINPTEGDYTGEVENVNFSTLSIIGGLQFKRINASVLEVKKPRVNRIFDNYTILTIDAILAPVNTFHDAMSGETVKDELLNKGFTNPYPIGARLTYHVYGSIPSSDLAKSFRYTISTSIGVRPYLGYHFDIGIGFMLLRMR